MKLASVEHPFRFAIAYLTALQNAFLSLTLVLLWLLGSTARPLIGKLPALLTPLCVLCSIASIRSLSAEILACCVRCQISSSVRGHSVATADNDDDEPQQSSIVAAATSSSSQSELGTQPWTQTLTSLCQSLNSIISRMRKASTTITIDVFSCSFTTTPDIAWSSLSDVLFALLSIPNAALSRAVCSAISATVPHLNSSLSNQRHPLHSQPLAFDIPCKSLLELSELMLRQARSLSWQHHSSFSLITASLNVVQSLCKLMGATLLPHSLHLVGIVVECHNTLPSLFQVLQTQSASQPSIAIAVELRQHLHQTFAQICHSLPSVQSRLLQGIASTSQGTSASRASALLSLSAVQDACAALCVRCTLLCQPPSSSASESASSASTESLSTSDGKRQKSKQDRLTNSLSQRLGEHAVWLGNALGSRIGSHMSQIDALSESACLTLIELVPTMTSIHLSQQQQSSLTPIALAVLLIRLCDLCVSVGSGPHLDVPKSVLGCMIHTAYIATVAALHESSSNASVSSHTLLVSFTALLCSLINSPLRCQAITLLQRTASDIPQLHSHALVSLQNQALQGSSLAQSTVSAMAAASLAEFSINIQSNQPSNSTQAAIAAAHRVLLNMRSEMASQQVSLPTPSQSVAESSTETTVTTSVAPAMSTSAPVVSSQMPQPIRPAQSLPQFAAKSVASAVSNEPSEMVDDEAELGYAAKRQKVDKIASIDQPDEDLCLDDPDEGEDATSLWE